MKQPIVDSMLVLRRRQLALVIIRIVAAALIVYGSIHVVWGIGTAFGLSGFSIAGAFEQAMSIVWSDNWNPFWYGFASLAVAIPLALASRRISRWIVPLPRMECPQCGYALRELTTTRCPECGMAIAPDARASVSNTQRG